MVSSFQQTQKLPLTNFNIHFRYFQKKERVSQQTSNDKASSSTFYREKTCIKSLPITSYLMVKDKCFLPRSGKRKGCLTISFQHCTRSSRWCNQVRKINKKTPLGKKKLLQFIDNIIISIKKSCKIYLKSYQN